MVLQIVCSVLNIFFFIHLLCKPCDAKVRDGGVQRVPNVTLAGYLPVNSEKEAAIFYTYYEAEQPSADLPIIIWLQVCQNTVNAGCIQFTLKKLQHFILGACLLA